MQKIDGKNINVLFTKEQVEKLDLICKRHKMKRTHAIRLMLDVGLDTYDHYSAVGLPQLAELVKKVRKAIREERQPRLL